MPAHSVAWPGSGRAAPWSLRAPWWGRARLPGSELWLCPVQVIAEDISINNGYVELSFCARKLDDKVRGSLGGAESPHLAALAGQAWPCLCHPCALPACWGEGSTGLAGRVW